MQILNSNTVVVFSNTELKEVLESENGYNYIFFGNNIILEEEITINSAKENVVINGTYLDVRYTYIVNNVDTNCVINAKLENKKVTVKNLDIVCTSEFGVIKFPALSEYKNTMLEYINIKFNGVQFGYNPYGKLKIIDCIVTIEDTNGISAQEAGEAAEVEIGGNTTITSNAKSFGLFFFQTGIQSPAFKVLANSRVNLRNETKEFMQGTNALDFKILHDADVTLVTGNGFASYTIHGARDVLIDERASFTFIENKHQRIPMWTIYGTLTVNEGATFQVINTYDNTPSDNYNLHFKGNNCKIILNNPHSFVLYTKNANVLYTNNPLKYTFNVSRINMWPNATQFSSAGDIYNLPDYLWYKDDGLINIWGTVTATDTSITSHNFTEKELSKISSLNDFAFQSRKQFSIGERIFNIHPITNVSDSISGYTQAFAEILIKYNDVVEVIAADENGFFEHFIETSISDNTEIEIISCVANSFIYSTRIFNTPHKGELNILEASNSATFLLSPISMTPVILPKKNQSMIKIVDSRQVGSEWKLYVRLVSPMSSQNGFILNNAVIFKKFNNEVVTLNDKPTLVFSGNNNNGNVELYNLVWSTEKGILLNLENNALEVNEEYIAKIIWNIEE